MSSQCPHAGTAAQEPLSFAQPEVQRNPFPLVSKLLAMERPVYPDPITGQLVVTRYSDIDYVLSNPKIFSSRIDLIFHPRQESPVREEIERRFRERGFPVVDTLVTNDPPSHTRYRSLVERVFTPVTVAKMEPRIREITNELIDDFIDTGRVDLLPALAVKLPMFFIAEQVGVPRADLQKIKYWTDITVERINPAITPERELEITDSLIELQQYLHDKILEYRDAPRPTLFSMIANAELDGQKLEIPPLLNIGHQLVGAGHETTTVLISTALQMLIDNREVMESLRSDQAQIPDYVEEVLRINPPIPHQYRVVKEDTEIGGVPVPKGSQLLMSYICGNHDPEKFVCPEAMEFGRKYAKQHLSFGRGIHYCIGNALARAEARIALEQVLERLPELRADPDAPRPQWVLSFQAHALDSVPVVF